MNTFVIIFVIFLILIVVTLVTLYFVKPEWFNKLKELVGLKKKSPVAYAEEADLLTLQATVNANAAALQALNDAPPPVADTTALQAKVASLESQLNTLKANYVDKSKPISLLASACGNKNEACPIAADAAFKGNENKALTVDLSKNGTPLSAAYWNKWNPQPKTMWFINQPNPTA